jgi:hypothetical protein
MVEALPQWLTESTTSFWRVRNATGIDPDLPKVQLPGDGANAYGCLPVLLRLQGLWRETEAAAGRLLRVLFLWIGAVPADPGARQRRVL